MPRFEPFRALRFAPSVPLDTVIAAPYDVMSDHDVHELAARDERNIVHVDVPRGGPDRYTDAAQRLRRWVAEGVMLADDTPSFTLYRMRFTDATGSARDLVGVLGGLEVVDEGAGGVLPHERTTPKASTDRLELTRATGCNLSPIWGLSLAHGLTEVLTEPGEPVGAVTVEGVEHVVERVTDPARLADIGEHLGGDDVLIADGHHRYGIARTYRDEVRAATGRTDTPAELTLAFVGELVADQLSIEAIHRLYATPHDELRADLARRFEIEPTSTAPSASLLAEMDRRSALALVAPDRTAQLLVPKRNAFAGVRALDGAYLEHALAGTRADVSGDAVSYQHGVDEVVAAVTEGRSTAGVLIRPVSITEIERTARERLLMPPKSTFFTPKLRTGFVVRHLTTG